MNKILRAATAAIMVMSMTAPVFAEPNTARFTDMEAEEYSWAKPYVNDMAERGLISGYEDNTYRPENDITHLEGLSLFARAMGSNDKANAEVLSLAHDNYDSVIRQYNLGWGTDEIAYLMYKGALKKTDLDTYLKDRVKDQPMQRYEAAIIITKAMGGESQALSDFGVVLDYADAREVPSNAIQYVAYATEMGIMEGMGDGIFSPLTPVKRSQMAVMLSRTVDKTAYTFVKTKIIAIDAEADKITVSSSAGKETEYAYGDATIMRSAGDETRPENMSVNIEAVLTFSGNNLIAVDTVHAGPEETVHGKYASYGTTSGKTYIRIIPDGETTVKSYECSADLSVKYDGSPATIRSFTKDDYVTMTIVNGKVSAVSAENKTAKISGAIVESLNVGNDITITINHGNSEYDGKTYPISGNVSVRKNDAICGLDSIYKGDKVTLTLEYGTITNIVATSDRKVVEGTIQGISISATSRTTMDVKVNGTVSTYEIPTDVKITINDAEGTLYDFRVGDTVKITLESDAITKIVATSTQQSSDVITGVVTVVNASYGVIGILPAGEENPIQIMCKDGTTTFITTDGKTKKMKDVKLGQTASIHTSLSNGVYVGKLVIILSE